MSGFKFNKALIAPIAAILYIILTDIFGVEVVKQEDLEMTLNVISKLLVAFGLFMHPKKPG